MANGLLSLTMSYTLTLLYGPYNVCIIVERKHTHMNSLTQKQPNLSTRFDGSSTFLNCVTISDELAANELEETPITAWIR